jgi:putative iron-dependent peroxidase
MRWVHDLVAFDQLSVNDQQRVIGRTKADSIELSEHGLYFVAFSAERSRYDRMLARMFGNAPDGLRDRLTDYSKPVSCAYYFAPSLNALAEAAGPE